MAHKKTPLPDLPIAEIRRVEIQPGSFATITVGYRTTDPELPCQILYSGGFETEPFLEWRFRDCCSMITWAFENDMRPDKLQEVLCGPEFQPHEIAMALKILEVAQTPPKWPAILRLT